MIHLIGRNKLSEWLLLALKKMLVILTLIASILASVTDAQRECLYRLYDETGGPNWLVQTNWPRPEARTPNDDPCTFYGITCFPEGRITQIVLSGNNLTGVLPDCLDTFSLTDLEVSTNHLHGPFPRVNCTELNTLYYKFNEITTLPPNICECNSLTAIHIEYNPLNTQTFPSCLLDNSDRFDIIYAVNTGMQPPNYDNSSGKQTLSAINLILGGNDLHLNLTAEALNLAERVTLLDLSATHSYGELDIPTFLTRYPSTRELLLQENELTGTLFDMSSIQSRTSLQILDVSGNLLIDTYQDGMLLELVDKLPLRMIGFKAGMNQIVGFAPSLDEYLAALQKRPSLQIFDLSGNPFFCNPNRSLAYNCTYLMVDKVGAEAASSVVLHIQTSTDAALRPLPLDTILPFLRVQLYNATGERWYNVSHIASAASITEDSPEYLITIHLTTSEATSIFGHDLSNISPKLVRFLYNDVIVTPQKERILTDLDSTPSYRQAEPIDNRVRIDLFGISRCPSFIATLRELIHPFTLRYPELHQVVDIHFMSQADSDLRYPAKGITMHGQTEVLGDRFLMCLRKYYDYFIFDQVTSCLYESGTSASIPYDLEKCFLSVIGVESQLNLIKECSDGDEATELITEAARVRREVCAAFSCTIYADSQLVCPYGDDICPFSAGDIDGFAQYVCKIFAEKNSYVHEMCNGLV